MHNGLAALPLWNADERQFPAHPSGRVGASLCIRVSLVIETGSVPIAILRHRVPYLVSGVRIVALLNKFLLACGPRNSNSSRSLNVDD